MIEIRKATVEDVDTIVGLNAALFKEDGGQRDKFMNVDWPKQEGEDHFREILEREGGLGLIAEADKSVAGYLIGYTHQPESYRPVKRSEIESMYVEEQFRSQGVGAQLVAEFFKWSKNQGVQVASVAALAKNQRAVNFYEKMGFSPYNVILEVEL